MDKVVRIGKKFYRRWRKALGFPVKSGSSAGSQCEICRSLDNNSEDLRIVALILETARSRGFEIWQLPFSQKIRLACSSKDFPALASALFEVSSAGRIEVEQVNLPVQKSVYELGDEPAPGQVLSLSVYARPHCANGNRYLPKRGAVLESVEIRGKNVIVPRSGDGPRVVDIGRMRQRTVSNADKIVSSWPFPIDLVYTWVDAADDQWKKDFECVAEEASSAGALKSAANAARWHSREELRFSLRSVEMYASWVRRIFIVTNGQVPTWLRQDERIKIVSHRELFPDGSKIPTFNSNAIETVLHRIDGLAEHFLYLNDDFFFGSPCTPDDFFTIGGATKLFLSPRHYDDRPVLDTDRPTVAAHKNTGNLLFERFNVSLHRKLYHAPHALRKSICEEAEVIWQGDLDLTRSHRFRSREDIAAPYLFQYYALLTSRGVGADISYGYLDSGNVNFAKRLISYEKKDVKVFCLNDSDLADDSLDHHGDLLDVFLRKRFPNKAPWEVSSVPEIGSLEYEIRRIGPKAAEALYRGDFERDPTSAGGQKLFTLLYRTGRFQEAAEVAASFKSNGGTGNIKVLDALSWVATKPSSLQRYVVRTDFRSFARSLRLVSRVVVDQASYSEFVDIAHSAGRGLAQDEELVRLLGSAARRAGLAKDALKLFESALASTMIPSTQKKDKRRDSQLMKDPITVLRDFLEIAGDMREEIFLDAGTLLGCIREGDFIGHDADIDLGTRNPEVLAELNRRMRADWRFTLTASRTPDILIQGKHINGTNLDVLLHRWDEKSGKWVKRSHVYGWRFEDYSLEEVSFCGETVKVPAPSIHYLEQMYGKEWSVPIAGFDSRLYAPNCFFPDQDEIICTVLGKAREAALVGDRAGILMFQDFLAEKFGYQMPMPKNM